MLDLDTRTTILRLAAQGHGIKTIAHWLGVSKNSVRGVLRSGQAEVPDLKRCEQLHQHVHQVRELYASCNGNLIRVREELAKADVEVAYSTLTSFCRRQGIGLEVKPRPGRYHFEPGEEMQHDTSPHAVKVGGRFRTLQCASLVMCFSRKHYAQVYPRWTRFEARVFLSEAIASMGGAAKYCMLDNSTVIIASGTGSDAIPAPAMKALADRFGFDFVAHIVGDANRSGRVERPFHYIEHNFYPGRTFADLADLNRQLYQWCETNFHRYRKRLQASPAELFVAEALRLRPLPPHIPEVYELHSRRVDIEGYVNLHTNRYSVDDALIGRKLEVRETLDRLRIFQGHRLVEEHDKLEYGKQGRQTLAKHQGQQQRHRKPLAPGPHEVLLRAAGPQLAALVDALRKRHGGRAAKALLRLHRLWTDYPTEAVNNAVASALSYGLTDLGRIERMVLRQIAGDFFRLPIDEDEPDD